jgi:hypothetical protein
MNYPVGYSQAITFLDCVTPSSLLNISSLFMLGMSPSAAAETKQASILSPMILPVSLLKPKGTTVFLCGSGTISTVSKSTK